MPLRNSPFATTVLRLGLALGMSFAALPGCKRQSSGGGELTPGQADQYIDRAVKKSSEGVVFFPSEAAQREFELPRLNEVAQSLRTPLALCFVQRAIAEMKRVEVDGELSYGGVPEGQAKVRARISQSGKVVSTEVLSSGFKDEQMLACVEKTIADKRFPPSRSGFNKHIDVVYWVSLGFFAEASTAKFKDYMRREQARAAADARDCLEGRIAPGHYEVEGLNLFDRRGNTIANRVEPGGMDPAAVQCLATTFKRIRIHEEEDAFVRPASPRTVIDVSSDGKIEIRDEEWLRLIELEEAAQREEKRRELLGADQEQMGGPIVPEGPGTRGEPIEVPPESGAETEPAPEPEAAPEPDDSHDAAGAIRLGPR